jgi:hypothetical protein
LHVKALYPRPTALARWFDRAPQFSAALPLSRKRETIDASLLSELLPEHLRSHVASMRLDGSCLEILARTPDAAHLARMERTSLLAAANAKGLKCNDFRVRIQVGTPPARIAAPRPGPAAVAKLNDAAARIKSERMQTALLRLSRTLSR